MAEANARVMNMVRKELEKDRQVATDVLYDKAAAIDSSISKLTARQFHAKYPLQIKRAMGKGKGKRKRAAKKRTGAKRATAKRATRKSAAKKTTGTARKTRTARRGPRKGVRRGARKTTRATTAAAAPSNGRDAVRDLLLRFAKQVATAENKGDMVDVMTGLEGWVDRVLAARD